MKNWFSRVGMATAALLILCAGVAHGQQGPLVIGFVLDGPWERNQEARSLLESRIRTALGGSVEFPAAKRLSGRWTRPSVAAALDRLLQDSEVDMVITLGLLSSHEAVSRTDLAKPVVASRVVGTPLLGVPESSSPAGKVSGIRNLTYLTLEGLDIRRSVSKFQRIRRFSRAGVLVARAFRDLAPDLEGLLVRELVAAGIPQPQIVFVGDSVREALTVLSPDNQAVILTLLPQLDPEDYSILLSALKNRRTPGYSVGGNLLVQLGALAGWGPADAVEEIAQRLAQTVRRIASGEEPETIPVQLTIDPRFTINLETVRALGMPVQDQWADALLVMKTIDTGATAPSMEGTADVAAIAPTAPAVAARASGRAPAEVMADLRRRIFVLASFGAFDAITPKLTRENDVILMGYAFRPGLREELDLAAGRIPGVHSVVNRIEVLPSSSSDDRIRLDAYRAIYDHPELRRYLPKHRGGSSGRGVELEGPGFPQGPHPIQILVKNGSIALIGQVSSAVHRQLADTQARSVSGVTSVETYLKVVSR